MATEHRNNCDHVKREQVTSRYDRVGSSLKVCLSEVNTKMKDNPAQITFHKRAIVALNALSIEDKNSVLKSINYLSVAGIDPAFGKNLKKFQIDEPLYLLRVNPSLRVILRVAEPDEIQILDIVTKERLELFAANKS